MSRLQIAFGIYALLAVVAWFTLTDERFRYLTIAILAFFALRSYTTHVREKMKEREGPDSDDESGQGRE